MIDPSGLNRQRDIVFSAEPSGQIGRAYHFLSGLPACKVEYGNAANTLRISYNLRNLTLEELVNDLTKKGFHFEHSVLLSIERNIIYYCEETICHNLDIPVYRTKLNEREIFVRAYDQKPHGDHDETPTGIARIQVV